MKLVLPSDRPSPLMGAPSNLFHHMSIVAMPLNAPYACSKTISWLFLWEQLPPSQQTDGTSSYHMQNSHLTSSAPATATQNLCLGRPLSHYACSWDYPSHEGFYVGRALHHYRCYRVLNKESRAVVITDAIKFRHHYLPSPDLTAEDKIIVVLQQLRLATKSPMQQLQAIYKLRDIFHHNATTAPNHDTTLPRVQALP
eukprot:CCRYP_016439-RB/>CCRYP_016439-RB protein AED:0.41 eAED:0.68 QI:0/0/0/1/0/0/2/0/197